MSATGKPLRYPLKPSNTPSTSQLSQPAQPAGRAHVEDDSLDDPVLVLTQRDLNQLSSIIGYNFRTRDELFDRIKALTHISVDGVSIKLEPALITRLKSRALNRDFGEFLTQNILSMLHGFVGY